MRKGWWQYGHVSAISYFMQIFHPFILSTCDQTRFALLYFLFLFWLRHYKNNKNSINWINFVVKITFLFWKMQMAIFFLSYEIQQDLTIEFSYIISHTQLHVLTSYTFLSFLNEVDYVLFEQFSEYLVAEAVTNYWYFTI